MRKAQYSTRAAKVTLHGKSEVIGSESAFSGASASRHSYLADVIAYSTDRLGP
jgi:hypothetical protein